VSDLRPLPRGPLLSARTLLDPPSLGEDGIAAQTLAEAQPIALGEPLARTQEAVAEWISSGRKLLRATWQRVVCS
jgi:hypothetical protein